MQPPQGGIGGDGVDCAQEVVGIARLFAVGEVAERIETAYLRESVHLRVGEQNIQGGDIDGYGIGVKVV
ncbi:MAG: hypothetical protein LUC93_18450 [Planctomycetaceae bacterium]|nr:hypothetical protein [Planctomycetaceae bacterium]